MRKRDVLWEALTGLRHRRLRAALCALGIALGIAAVVAVVAIPASSQAALLDRLGRDGNLLTVASGHTIDNTPAPLPRSAAGMLRRLAGVEQVAPVGYVAGATIRHTDAIPPANTNGIAVMTADTSLVATLNVTVVSGRFLDAATDRYPAVVLGAGAARALGIVHVTPDTQVYLGSSDMPGGQYATVLGVLAPVPLAPELDTAALFGNPAAGRLLGFDGAPNRIYLRAQPDQVPAVRGLLAPTTNPADPSAVSVGRPSDLLVARAAAGGALTTLALGLGAIALLVGGVGVANVMVVSVLERRSEVGLRRALGATRATVGLLFLIESTLLCLLGAVAGSAVGVAATVAFAAASGIPPVLPWQPLAAGLAGALLIGMLAGLYPAARAARLSPTDALRTP